MKNYLKNKNFIPKKYLKNAYSEKDKGNKRGVIYLVIINLFIMPVTVEALLKRETIKVNEVPVFREEGVSRDSIIGWINEIDKEIEELVIIDNSAVMTVKDISKIYSLEDKEDISINNITQNEKGYYILEVTKEK